MPDIDFAQTGIPYEQLARLEVHMEDFIFALREWSRRPSVSLCGNARCTLGGCGRVE